jgi:hypothetical protein
MTARPAAARQASGVFDEYCARGLEKRARPTIFP